MQEGKKTLNPILSAVIGGLIVAIVGIVAISAGWIKSEDGEKAIVKQAPISKPSQKNGEGPTVAEVYKKESSGVVFIKAQITTGGDELSPFGSPEPRKGTASGSGFVIDDDGHIVTNAHVISDADEVTVEFDDDKSTKAKVIGKDTSVDIAILKAESPKGKMNPLPLGESKDLKVGDPVIAIGNPFGLDRTVTTGIVSALQREIRAPNGFTIKDVIQTDASINPGNSGGPLLDAVGKVVGVNSQIATAGGGSEGVGFAVPIDTVRDALPQLKSKGKVERAFMGITGLSLDAEMLKELNLPTDEGVLIQEVSKDGPAKKAGLKGGSTQVTVNGTEVMLGGDIIKEVDGKKIKDMEEVVELVDSKKPGDKIKVKYLREKKEKTATVKLGARPDSQTTN